MPVRLAAGRPAAMTSPPTIAKTSTGGDPSPITGSAFLPWNTDRVTHIGASPLTAYVMSGDATNRTYAAAKGGLEDGTPVAITEFDFYGSDFALRYHHANTSVRLWVFVNGEAVTATPDSPAGSASSYQKWYRVTFATAEMRRIRVVYESNVGFSGISFPPTSLVMPTRRPAIKLAALGDSWIAATAGGLNPSFGYIEQAGRMLDLAVANYGQGGTGYIATPGTPAARQVFGSTERVASLVASAPDYVYIAGSINDADSAAVQTAAAALYATLATELPNARLIVCGVQRRGTNVPASDVANNNRIKAAALAAPNVVAFLDPITDQVIMGTGRVGATTGDGVADVAMQSDGSHLTAAGYDIYTRWLVSKLATILAAGGVEAV